MEKVAGTCLQGVARLVESVFHNNCLLVQPEIFLRDDELRTNNDWRSWPKEVTSIGGSDMGNFISRISYIVEKLSLVDIEPRFWSSMFHQHPIPDSERQTESEPSLVLLQRPIAASGCNSPEWKDVVSVMEIEKSKDGETQANLRVAQYAECIFDAQPGRRFVVAVTVVERMVTLWIFDRSGAISSEPFDINEKPELFLRIIIGTLYVDMEQLGYDRAIRQKGDNLYIQLGGIDYKIECIHKEGGIEGWGTLCFRGERNDGQVVAIKESWIDCLDEETEIDILKGLQASKRPEELCTPDGVRVIPELIYSEVAQTLRPSSTGGGFELVEDNTAIFRHEYVDFDDKKKPKSFRIYSDNTRLKTEYGIRRLVRVVTTPFAQPVENFKSKKGLVRALIDVVHAIKILYDSRIVHRNISTLNIMLHEHNGALRGLLIDYELALAIDNASEKERFEKNGTTLFMAIDRLEDKPEFPHSYFHDLESLFIVICWMCIIYDGPCNTRRSFDSLPFRDTVMSVWYDNLDMGYNAASKIAHLVHGKGFQKLVGEFSDYFKSLADCPSFFSLRKLLFLPIVQDQHEVEDLERNVKAKLKEDPPKSRKELIQLYNDIPIYKRPADIVFESFLALLENLEGELSAREENEAAPSRDQERVEVGVATGIKHEENVGERWQPGSPVQNPSPHLPSASSRTAAKRKSTDTEETHCDSQLSSKKRVKT